MRVLILLLAVVSLQAEEDVNGFKVQTSSGVLAGFENIIYGKKVQLFLGVPYAQPPIESLRFQKPQPLDKPSVEEFDATSYGPSCIQPHHVESVISPLLNFNNAEISEDCLYLNVYAPVRDDISKNIPVMVWLAGEGFDFADPRQYNGSFLAATGQVIVVTVNYRLSAFGFLSTLSDEAPGNVGLYDQRLALKWVQDNIANFGGNPQNVTLFGRFTGSMSAAIHAFSPLSKEESLFQSVILQSGVPDGDWAYEKNPVSLTTQLAEVMDCVFEEISETVSCLKEKPAEDILKSTMDLKLRFRPVLDFNLIHDNVVSAVKNNQYATIPVMVGLNENEGTLCTTKLKAMQSEYYEQFVSGTLTASDFSKLVNFYLDDYFRNKTSAVSKVVEFVYRGSQKGLNEDLLHFCGDLFIYSIAETFTDELSSLNKPVYVYNFQHRPSFSAQPSFISAAHGDDVLFGLALTLQVNLSDDELLLTNKLVTAFTNFATYGNPNAAECDWTWPLYTKEDRMVKDWKTGDAEATDFHPSVHQKASEFWEKAIDPIIQSTC